MRELYSTTLAIVASTIIVLLTLVFALIQSPEARSAPERIAAGIPHPVDGRARCDACHGVGGARPYPIRHLGWSNLSCAKCHPPLPATAETLPAEAPGDEGGEVPFNPHPGEGWDDCLACHAVDGRVRPAPSDHGGWANDDCAACHPRSPGA